MRYEFPRESRLSFFKQQLGAGSLSGKRILDVGGNHGNLLKDLLEEDYNPADYTCLDVDAAALQSGRAHCAEAAWIHHNAFNQVYNQAGEHDLAYPFQDTSFDLVLAYSVHSHTTFEQMLFDLTEMIRVLKPGGSVVTSIVDASSIVWFLRKRARDYGQAAAFSEFKNVVNVRYLIDHSTVADRVDLTTDMELFVSVYNVAWLVAELRRKGFDADVPFDRKFLSYNQKGLVIKK